MNDFLRGAILSAPMWHKVLKRDEIVRGMLRCVTVEGKKILISFSDGSYYACGAICPHQGVSMEEGLVFDDEITCPEHSWVFSLKTGELTWPGSGPRIPVYPIRVTGEEIEVYVE